MKKRYTNPICRFQYSAERARFPGGLALCGWLGQALRSDAYVGFREGQLTLVNIAEVSD